MEDPSNVWDSDYQAVWHLCETGTGVRYDSTSNDNDGTPGEYDGDEASTGWIDGSDDFDGVNDNITLNTSPDWSYATNGTISAWIRSDGGAGVIYRVMRCPSIHSSYGHPSSDPRMI